MTVKRIGLDLAKNEIELVAVDEHERAVTRKRLKRGKLLDYLARLEPTVVAMEACAGAHDWARKLSALGHEPRLMAPRFVAPYRKNDKNDRNDAEAICEAAGRPNMRYVPVKSAEQQAVLSLHRSRELVVRQRTALINHLRGALAEFGVVVAQGAWRLRRALPEILEDAENGLPDLFRELLAEHYARLRALDDQIAAYDARIAALAREMEPAQRLMTVEGVGPVVATAVVAAVGDARVFANGRQFSAWLGIVPRQYSSGPKVRHGRITKRGDRYLRKQLIHGARAAIRQLRHQDSRRGRWVRELEQRRGFNKAVVALAAKNARLIWALLAKETSYRPEAAAH